MAYVEVAPAADQDIDALLAASPLPADTRDRIRDQLGQLETFPESGQMLTGLWAGYRKLSGPFGWMLLIYEYNRELDRVLLVTVQDARRADAAS